MKINILRNGKFRLSAFIEKEINGIVTIYTITFEDKNDIIQYGTVKLYKEFKGGTEIWKFDHFTNTDLLSLKSDFTAAIMKSENDEMM